ncbi:MAG TPA: PH domain-containing protein [Gaiellaceae bacterium]|nr:PH domain-containing protein [Gaiellaceae bacterium]
MNDSGWARLHPVSPFVRGGRATIGIFVLLVPDVLLGRSIAHDYVPIAIAGGLVAVGFVSWLVTRWRIDADDLQIETGLVRRRSLRFPLSQVQAIDVVRPGLARMFRVAELRLRMGGASGSTARLAYLPEHEVEPLRARLLSLADGAVPHEEQGEPATVEEHLLTTVPTARLVASILISDVGVVAEAALVALIVTGLLAPAVAVGVITGGTAAILAIGTAVWRRFNQEYRLSVAETGDGLRLHSGLVALTTETIRPGRVQGVRMVEPLLWRRLGWCRLEVDLAGRQRSKGEGQAERGKLRAVLPVGSRSDAERLLDRIVPDRPREQSRPPARAGWKSPLRYRFLAWGRTETCLGTTSGRLRRVTAWVPLEKAQSIRYVQGPLQRRLRLASVHVDVAGRGLHATIRDRDAREAERVLGELPDLAREARVGRVARAADAALAGSGRA